MNYVQTVAAMELPGLQANDTVWERDKAQIAIEHAK